jgi:hypothetical protein
MFPPGGKKPPTGNLCRHSDLRKGGGGGLGRCPSIVFMLNSRFFGYWFEEVQNRKQKYFLNDYLGGVKTGKNEKLAFHETQN